MSHHILFTDISPEPKQCLTYISYSVTICRVNEWISLSFTATLLKIVVILFIATTSWLPLSAHSNCSSNLITQMKLLLSIWQMDSMLLNSMATSLTYNSCFHQDLAQFTTSFLKCFPFSASVTPQSEKTCRFTSYITGFLFSNFFYDLSSSTFWNSLGFGPGLFFSLDILLMRFCLVSWL